MTDDFNRTFLFHVKNMSVRHNFITVGHFCRWYTCWELKGMRGYTKENHDMKKQ